MMDLLNPIHTETVTCQDCYKCLRECSVKAIQIEKSCARIIPGECTLCGHCVSVCPTGAKKVRDDTGRFRALRQSGRPMVALVAPSWVGEYPELDFDSLCARIAGLGFSRVAEVSTGAHAVNLACARIMEQAPADRKLFISSACPTVVRYLQIHRPHMAGWLLEVESPLETTARMARARWGNEIACVFFGPCIAKKVESDRNRDLLDIALTWQDLDQLAGTAPSGDEPDNPGKPEPGIRGNGISGEASFPTGGKAHLYPIDGGMTAGLRQIMGRDRVDSMVFSGMDHVRQALEGLDPAGLASPLFLELMACEGGCVNGPRTRRNRGTIVKRLDVIREQGRPLDAQGQAAPRDTGISGPVAGTSVHAPAGRPVPPVQVRYVCTPDSPPVLPGSRIIRDDEVAEVLARIGKHNKTDELNCSACGYDSCRDFARACLQGKAETTMCVSWMRNLVKKKADALLATMPSGVVILDRDLKVVESNRNFARMMGPEVVELFDLHPGLAGADGNRFLPGTGLFRQVLSEPGLTLEEDLEHGGRILHCHIFGIEAGQVAGGLFQDVTLPTVQRDRVVTQAQEVIRKHLEVVQQIAFLLGENAAESESILNSIIQSFSNPHGKGDRP